LTWDGATPIACANGVAASGGNITASGSITPGSFTTGSACSTEGAMGYDMSAHARVYCSKQLVWTGDWVNVPLTDTNNFDVNCTYKAYAYDGYFSQVMAVSPQPEASVDEWLYFSFNFPSMLCVTNNGGTSYGCVEATNKSGAVLYNFTENGWIREPMPMNLYYNISLMKNCTK
jgi:hypothetical protein